MPATMLSGQIQGQYDELYAKRRLAAAGLKPTRQRVALCTMLFEGPPRHVTVEELHRQAADTGHRLSLATVYNTLKQFGEAGLVRRISVPGGRGYFDVDTGDHHHFYIADEDRIIDIPVGSIALGDLPEPPAGYRIDKVDIVVHLKREDGDRD
jgi:Fur family transcriptional regulator, iron response regulator